MIDVGTESRRRRDFECSNCGYRAAFGPPSSCPMCRGADWLAPGSRRAAPITVTRLADAVFVVRPPRTIDRVVGLGLSETFAELAHEQPEVVLDLTEVDDVEAGAERLIAHLSAMTRCAGGRLLAICPTGSEPGFRLRDLERAPGAGLHDAFASALRDLRRRER